MVRQAPAPLVVDPAAVDGSTGCRDRVFDKDDSGGDGDGDGDGEVDSPPSLTREPF